MLGVARWRGAGSQHYWTPSSLWVVACSFSIYVPIESVLVISTISSSHEAKARKVYKVYSIQKLKWL